MTTAFHHDGRWFERLVKAVERIAKEAHPLVSTIADLKAAADQLAANDAALAAEVGTLSTAVDNLVTAFEAAKNGGGLSAEDQAALDAAVQEVTDASTDVANQTSSLSAEEGKATNA